MDFEPPHSRLTVSDPAKQDDVEVDPDDKTDCVTGAPVAPGVVAKLVVGTGVEAGEMAEVGGMVVVEVMVEVGEVVEAGEMVVVGEMVLVEEMVEVLRVTLAEVIPRFGCRAGEVKVIATGRAEAAR